MSIVSAVLLLVTAAMNLVHGWGLWRLSPEAEKMVAAIGLGRPGQLVVAGLTVSVSALLLWSRTFFAANVLQAALLVSLMAMLARAHQLRGLLIEIPFLAVPFVLIYLGHPLARS